ncbi:MAG: hypothetical protein IAE78_15425 [Myxococcus sp.]|nr:hypothetical protein [Myxococcus sp.]
MNVEVFVLGREQLPRREGGWTLSVGPVRVLEGVDVERLRELPALAPLLTALTFTSPDERACLAMAREAAQLVRGQVVTNAGLVLHDFEHDPQAPLSAATVESRWREVLEEPPREVEAMPSAPGDQNDWSRL